MKALVAVALLLASTAPVIAVPVDLNAPDGIAARQIEVNSMIVLCTDGRVFSINTYDRVWTFLGDDLPVPIVEIADWHLNFIRTHDGALWMGNLHPTDSEWQLVPPLPCSTAVREKTPNLGQLKSMFR
jgi:hypothetical protein